MLARFEDRTTNPDALYELRSYELRSTTWIVQLFIDDQLLCDEITNDYTEVQRVSEWFETRFVKKPR
jgi:hypothetical protein